MIRVNRIVLLGGGFAGMTLATELDSLAASRKCEVTLIDRSDAFRMGLSMEWVLAGRRRPEDGSRTYAQRRAKHVRFLRDEIVRIDTADRSVRTTSERLEYDQLVIALGAELRPDLLPGLADGAHNLCDMDSVVQLRDAIERINRGTVLIAITSLPFKCPPAPYEYALLIEDRLRRRGVRDRVDVVVTTPEPQPMPAAGKAVGDAVKMLLAERGISYRTLLKPKAVDPVRNVVLFEDGTEQPYDVLAAMPPHRAPKAVVNSGLTDSSGFVPVTLGTFETSEPDVYALGDVAAVKLSDGRPHPKAGVFAEAQALVVAGEITAKLGGGSPEPYTGRGICYVDSGRDEAAPAEIHVLAPGGPHASIEDPSARGLEEKRRFEAERLEKWFVA
ncbi:MAG: NAD(P)/FAD-dependent oxidoreductase [Thermoplasmata archaeon]